MPKMSAFPQLFWIRHWVSFGLFLGDTEEILLFTIIIHDVSWSPSPAAL